MKHTHLLLLSANPALSTDDKVRVHVDRDNGEGVRGWIEGDGTNEDSSAISLKQVEVNTTKRLYHNNKMWNRNRMPRSSSTSSDDLSRETTCGLGPYRPSYLQRLASKKVYMFFYGTLGIIQGQRTSVPKTKLPRSADGLLPFHACKSAGNLIQLN